MREDLDQRPKKIVRLELEEYLARYLDRTTSSSADIFLVNRKLAEEDVGYQNTLVRIDHDKFGSYLSEMSQWRKLVVASLARDRNASQRI